MVEVVHGHHNAGDCPASIVAIGNFDGVHLGHRALIQRARSMADARGGRVVALTFDPHPASVLSPQAAPPMLASLDRRLELLAQSGVDVVVVEPFTRELASASANTFVERMVVESLRAAAIVVGYDFCYGAGRTGTVDSLRSHGTALGIDVEIVPAVEVEGEIASSTRIRGHLREGDLVTATRLLGRSWDVDGVVVHGAKRGRAIGVPTANVRTAIPLCIPPGIYAVHLEACTSEAFGMRSRSRSTSYGTVCKEREGEGSDGGQPQPSLSIHPPVALPAVASYGRNPTFVEGGDLVLEVHVLDWAGDLYDQRVRTSFAARLRDEMTFSSTAALVEQIQADIAAARLILQR